MKIIFSAAIFLLASCAALAQNQVNGPNLNGLFDPSSGVIRRIIGTPGAAHFGPPIQPGFRIASAIFSPDGRYALAVRDSDRQVFVLSFASLEPAYSAISGLVSADGHIVISPGGAAAAVCIDGCRTIMRLAGLPDSPVAAGTVVFDRVDTLAIDDNGALLAAAADGAGASLLYSGKDGATRVIGHAGSLRGLAISADGNTGLFADAAAGTLVRIDDLPGAATFTTIAGADQGIAGPIGVAISRSGRLAFAALESSIVAVDLPNAAPSTNATRLDAPCAITGLDYLAGDAVLRLTADAGAPLWLFDADSSQPRFVFVPAPASAPLPEAIQ